jgi:hypothetical protein
LCFVALVLAAAAFAVAEGAVVDGLVVAENADRVLPALLARRKPVRDVTTDYGNQ